MVIVLMLAGFLFLFLKIVIPGFGITGVIGILLLGGGIVAAYIRETQQHDGSRGHLCRRRRCNSALLWFFFIFPSQSG